MVRRCVFGCTSPRTLFTFPTDPWLRKRWLEFAHLEESGIRSSSRICDRHFPDDSFNNLGLFNARITSYLRLIENAVPSLYTVGAPASVTPSFRSIGCQYEKVRNTANVSVQANTSKIYRRSKAIQVWTVRRDTDSDVDSDRYVNKRNAEFVNFNIFLVHFWCLGDAPVSIATYKML
ncbi:hypothetical protein C0J45_13921 [Silurus meridionalis]|nr:hypothetical protein C0J45_13921 [Silurus meridionalis]